MLALDASWMVLLAIVGVGVWMLCQEYRDRRGPRRRCRGGCDPRHLITTWEDSHFRKVRCQKCGWLSYAERTHYTRG